MPHGERKKSETGFYHVVVKGDGGQILFEGDGDRKRFLEELKRAKADHGIAVHAYCLMSNHVHLLVEDAGEGRDGLGPFMKQLCERYAMHFRKRTGRVGHVFQGRYWSEPIGSDEYFLACLRYIHANPEPAGIGPASGYTWSSYSEYAGKPGFGVASTELALGLLGGPSGFESFQENGGAFARAFPKSSLVRHLSYDELLRIAKNVLGEETFARLKEMDPDERAENLRMLAAAGFTESQIARLTGIGRSSIVRSLK